MASWLLGCLAPICTPVFVDEYLSRLRRLQTSSQGEFRPGRNMIDREVVIDSGLPGLQLPLNRARLGMYGFFWHPTATISRNRCQEQIDRQSQAPVLSLCSFPPIGGRVCWQSAVRLDVIVRAPKCGVQAWSRDGKPRGILGGIEVMV